MSTCAGVGDLEGGSADLEDGDLLVVASVDMQFLGSTEDIAVATVVS
jgi:hypothetical protein